MTKPRYPQGCADRSQERREASPDASNPDYAWIVNFNYGNSNLNHRDNRYWVRPVRASECPSAAGQNVLFRDLYKAWRRARRHKKASSNQLAFESIWIDRLFDMQAQLNAGTWTPAPSVCFVATAPKAREIHAPDFFDRVVHHWLVPQLEAIYEPTFIAHSFANRKGKGTHAAVDQLTRFVRQAHSGQGGGYYLQLDVYNFFNSIHRPTLHTMLKHRMERAQLPLATRQAAHALLRQAPLAAGVRHLSTAAERAQVPAHKRLENSAPGCGLPIGNLSSQFFANVYLDRLDQFVKHELKCKRYLRYVDDFVLVHESRAQLETWKERIEEFLQRELRLQLKDDIKLRPLTAGIDFLGYVIYPTHARVRRRVVSHAKEKLAVIERQFVSASGHRLRATPAQIRAIQSVIASYDGHFAHARARKLRAQLQRRFPWLGAVTARRRFDYRLEGRRVNVPIIGRTER